MTRKPIWLSGSKPADWAKSFANPVRISIGSADTRRHFNRTTLVRHVLEKSTLGQYASFDRKNTLTPVYVADR